MNNIKYWGVLSQILVLACSISGCAQEKDSRVVMGQKSVQKELEIALRDSLKNKKGPFNGLLIKNKTTAIQVAEPLLFSIYGQDNIKRQRPYEAHLLNGYWVLSGSLPTGHDGGTFLLIMSARNCQIIQLTHSK